MTTESNTHTLIETVWEIRDDMFWQEDTTGVKITALPMVDRLLDDPLIKAAPKLMAALTWLLDDLTDAGEDRHPETGEEYDSVAFARVAIALANGKVNADTEDDDAAADAA
jgi:hypothetical protein